MRILKEDEIKSPYDLREMLWYIIPGATLLLLIFFFEFWFATQIRGVHPNSIYEKDKLDSIQTLFISSDSTQKIILARERDSLSIRHQMYENLFDSLHTPIFSALSITHTPLFENVKGEKTLIDNWVLAALYFLLLLTISYIIGHLTYIFGTFIYERGLISKGFSYPYLKLLGLEEGAQKDNPSQRSMEEIIASQSFYRGMYFWSAFIFIFSYILFLYWVKYWGISYLEYYRYLILLITLLLIFFPIRLKFILSKITDFSIYPFFLRPISDFRKY
ncbi:MAG TPA: hypothetical protein DCX92_01910, partial [Bacteroidetes bacterium]|nr:hypothetical protein [Bacteroidota bacterium]